MTGFDRFVTRTGFNPSWSNEFSLHHPHRVQCGEILARLRNRLTALQFGSARGRFRPAVSLCVMSLEGPVGFEEGRQGSYLRALVQRLREGLDRGRRKASDQTHWLKAENSWSLSEWWRKL